jgi:hypothetical protein
MWNIERLIAESGDAQLVSLSYKDDSLIVELELDEADCRVQASILTDTMRITKTACVDEIFRTCRLEKRGLSSGYVKNGYLVPPQDFSAFMKEIRRGFNLAYGHKLRGSEFLLAAVGHTELFCCFVEDALNIKVVEVLEQKLAR